MKVPLAVRIDPGLLERLKAQARRENRTLSNMVDTALRHYLDTPTKPDGADNRR